MAAESEYRRRMNAFYQQNHPKKFFNSQIAIALCAIFAAISST
jgi:hypothetical protein